MTLEDLQSLVFVSVHSADVVKLKDNIRPSAKVSTGEAEFLN